MKALIIAGGKGTRLEEVKKDRNKTMLEIYDKTLLEYNLDRAIEMEVSEVILVLFYRHEEIIKKIGREYGGVKIKYVVEKRGRGIVTAIENAKKEIGKSDFILILGDEVMINADMKGMLRKFREEELFVVCGIVYEKDKSSIKRTYSVMVNKDGRVFRLIEKPRLPINNIKGTGHCIFRNEILDYIDKTPINAYRGQKEMVDMIQCAVDDGKNVKIYKIADGYINVNNFEDLNTAKENLKKSNPKVLIVHNQMRYYGGAELLIVELANWLTKKGIKNDILALSSSKEVEKVLLNTEVIIPDNDIDLRPPGYKNIKDIFKAIGVFRKKLREIEKNYDVINFHDFPVTWSLWPRKKPAVWFMNLPPSLWSKPNAGFFYKTLNRFRIWLDKFIVRHSIDIVTVAESLNQIRAKQRYEMDAKLIDFGVDYDFFSKGNGERARQRYNLKNKFIVIQSGMFCDIRNQLESIKTIEKVRDKIPNIVLVLTGKIADGDYKKKIDDYIKKNKLEKNILVAGYLKTRGELRDFYKAADVGLFPTKKQGGILVPFETLCAEVPIIVSEDIETALLIKEKNLGIVTKDYANALLEIYNNQERYKQQAKKSAKFIKDNISWKAFSEKMVKAYLDAWKRYKKD